MNTSIENIVCVHKVYKKVFEQLMLAVASSSSLLHGSPRRTQGLTCLGRVYVVQLRYV